MFRRWLLRKLIASGLLLALGIVTGTCLAFVQEYESGIIWPESPVVTPGENNTAPPSDAIVLFDGKDLSAFNGGDKWEIEDGCAVVRGGGVTTKRAFGDCQLHVEFAAPDGRGNSGMYLMGRYELQFLDSYENKTYFDGQCGAVYKQQPPTVNACRKPGEWQTMDIIFTAPKFDDAGKVIKPAYVTVLHNGVVIHNHFELQGSTSYVEAPRYSTHPDKLPIHIEHQGYPLKFRNMWIRENIQPLVGKQPEEKIDPKNTPQPLDNRR